MAEDARNKMEGSEDSDVEFEQEAPYFPARKPLKRLELLVPGAAMDKGPPVELARRDHTRDRTSPRTPCAHSVRSSHTNVDICGRPNLDKPSALALAIDMNKWNELRPSKRVSLLGE